MQSVKVAAAAVALLFAGHAAAQTASFNMGTVAMEVPLPAGYCLPAGAAVEKARIGTASDPNNVTHATIYACAQMQNPTINDYYLIKTPRTLIDTPLTRAEVLASLTAEMEDPNFSVEKLSSEAGSSATKSISEATGTATRVVTDIRSLGRDQDCAYMGGVVVATTDAGSRSANVGGCITAVGDRIVMVFRYTKGTNVAAAAKLLPDARKLATSIRVKP